MMGFYKPVFVYLKIKTVFIYLHAIYDRVF